MSGLIDMLDQLDEARAKGTPGPWKIRDDGVTVEIEGGDRESVRDKHGFHDTDAALIVAAVNALPQLTAALRAVAELAEEWRYKGEFGNGPWQEGYGPDLEGHVLDHAAAELLRALTAALTPGADTAGATA